MAKKQQRSPRRTKVATKNGTDYGAVAEGSKPVCPECEVRDYTIQDYDMKSDGTMKFFAKCNNCKFQFVYFKPLSSVFNGGENNEQVCNESTNTNV